MRSKYWPANRSTRCSESDPDIVLRGERAAGAGRSVSSTKAGARDARRFRRLPEDRPDTRERILQIWTRVAVHAHHFFPRKHIVAGAILGQVSILHRADTRRLRDVSPQRLVHYRENWYLDAWCHSAKGLRSFALERIRELNRTEERAREVPESKMSEHFDQSYVIFSGPAEHLADLRFSPEMSRWISEENWHPDQQGHFEDDGSWLLAYDVWNETPVALAEAE